MITVKAPPTREQSDIISSLAEKCGVSYALIGILFSRGVDTEEKIRRFLSPGKHNFASPFLMKGMRETVERLTAARDNNEAVVIYGDYDADGICATSIMYYALREFGVDACPVIPERADGYGLSEKLIEKLMEDYNPDLIITVDCGISGHDEVEYIKDLGVDVIVTDHHELPEVLPDCVIVNCKLKGQEYAFDGLCGAGVAFKIACALLGDKANVFLDFAALATVADSMPLVDENRDIVVEGLKLINSPNARTAFKVLAETAKVKEINSTALAFSLAPRINAAGRMGDAHCALRLFLSESMAQIFELAAKLNQYNMQRQAECDELYTSARSQLLKKGPYKRVILLEDARWKNGLLGIAAAKLVEEFTRPVIMFINKNGVLHGSARSVEDINILDAISCAKEYLTEFGGHSQAAGVSLSAEDLPAFENALDAYISQKYGDEAFVPKHEAEAVIDGEFPMEFARELEKLEPFGTGNKKPLFAVDAASVTPRFIKEGSQHITFSTEYMDFVYFGGAQHISELTSHVKKTILFEPNISRYNGTESLRGYVKALETEVIPCKELGLEAYMANIKNLLGKGGEPAEYVSRERIDEILLEAQKCPYGTLYVISSLLTLDSFPELKTLPLSLNAPAMKNFANCVVLVLNGGDVSGFKNIIYLDDPVYPIRKLRSINVYVNKDIEVKNLLPKVSATREGIAEVFAAVKNLSGTAAYSSAGLYEAVKQEVPQIARYQFVFGVEVLSELGIIKFENGRMRYDKSARGDLSASKIYRRLGGE